MEQDIAIEGRALTKSFNGVKAVDQLDFKIHEGECYGFLGARGAGKSTLVRLLSCCSPPSAGALFIMGLNALEHQEHIKRRAGVVSRQFVLDSDFSVYDNLAVYGHLHGMPRRKVGEVARHLLRRFQLEDFSDLTIDQLSAYKKRELELARALMTDPDLLFLDQPMEGMGVDEMRRFYSILRTIKAQGKTIVLATTSTTEVEGICDRVALLDKGKILHEGVQKTMIEEVVGQEVVEFFCPTNDLDYYLARLKGRYEYQVYNNRVRVFMGIGQESRSVLNYVSSENLTIRRSHLGDAYLKIVGREL